MPSSQELSSTQEQSGPNPAGSSFERNNSFDDVSGVYGVVKCYFYTPKRGDIWGAFCTLFDGTTGDIMDNVFWVTRALVGPSIDVNMQWRSLNKLIPKMGAYEKVLGEKLSVLLVETFSSAARVELCRSDKVQEKLQDICGEIRNCFERTTHCFLEFKIGFERMSAQELANALDVRGYVSTAKRTKFRVTRFNVTDLVAVSSLGVLALIYVMF